MRIAFDLDDTLIPCLHDFPTEALPFWARVLTRERIRRGTRRVINQLLGLGHEVWVYTTSHRSPFAIRSLFLLHGLRVQGVINGHRHWKQVGRGAQPYRACAKYPPHFGIDVLVDDLEGIAIEAERHGYAAVIVRPDDEHWDDRLIAALGRLGVR